MKDYKIQFEYEYDKPFGSYIWRPVALFRFPETSELHILVIFKWFKSSGIFGFEKPFRSKWYEKKHANII